MTQRVTGEVKGWRSRPVLSFAVRAAVFAVPIAAGFGAAMLAGRNLPKPHGLARTSATLFVLLGSSTLALVVADRLMRRLLPLAWLLKLTLVFPDRVPSRMAMARRAGDLRHYRRQLEDVRLHGLGTDVEAAA